MSPHDVTRRAALGVVGAGSVIALAAAAVYGGVSGLVSAVILIVLEIVFSFDNAGVNAKYLNKMSHAWRNIFLTVGVLVAVFGMRLIFPPRTGRTERASIRTCRRRKQ